MKSNIQLVDTKTMTQEDWLRYRKSGIGASEAGIIMGLSPYKASIQLFYEKIGEDLGFTQENLAMFLGKESEGFLADMWEAWEGDVESMIRNYRADVKVRRCKKVNAYAINPKYPWLFVSLDREINQHAGRGNGALELKTIGGWDADKWISGFPPIYVIQVMQQCGVCEYEYGESAILRDNREFFVLPFEFDAGIFENIAGTTKSFWDKVEKAKSIVTARFEANRVFNGRLVEELTAELQELEPEPDGTEAFNQFLKDKYKIALPGEQPGSLQDLADAQAHKAGKNRLKEIQEDVQLHENRLKTVFGQKGCDRLDFGTEGYVSWKMNTNGSRVFLNKVKE